MLVYNIYFFSKSLDKTAHSRKYTEEHELKKKKKNPYKQFILKVDLASISPKNKI